MRQSISDLIVDSFAGGGGASLGISMALGREPDIAINHDGEALAMHAANHPDTLHLPHDVWKVNPLKVTAGKPVGLLWASPDCKHHSKAKGGKPKEKRIRDLAWVVVRWAKSVRPKVIGLENVEEFADWGPLQQDGAPCPARRGQTFADFVAKLERVGYHVEYRELRACDYGAPTIRKRLFLIARCDGLPIVWPEPTHGDPRSADVAHGKLLPWRTAAEIIDWSRPCHSIFLTREAGREVGVKRPLAPATMARVAKGVKRYVLDTAEPFIVSLTHQGSDRVESLRDPLKTLTSANRGEKALVAPVLTYAQQGGRSRPAESPLHTVTASPKDQNAIIVPHLMTMRNAQKPFNECDKPVHTITAGGAGLCEVAAFLAQQNTDMVGHDLREPLSTIVGKGCTQTPVAVHLLNMKGSDQRSTPADAPMPTQTAHGNHIGTVGAALVKYYGTDQDPRLNEPLHTVTTKDRFGLADVSGGVPPLSADQLERARAVAKFLREHGCWNGGELVTVGPYIVVDIGLRMLTPRELARGQGFPDSYILEADHNGAPLTKTSQTRMIGNSVCPDVARAVIFANLVLAPALKAPPPVYRAWGADLKERLVARQRIAAMRQENLFEVAA